MKREISRLSIIVLISLNLFGCKSQPASTQTGVPFANETSLPPTAELTSAPTDTPLPTDTPTLTPTPEGPQAVVAEVINQVEAHAVKDADWAEALVDMVVYLGGEVWAKEASTARLRLEESIVRVAPNTIFTFQEPQENSLQIDLQEGQIWLNVEGLAPGESLNVTTPSAVASVRGTRFSVRVDEFGQTIVSCVVGNVDVSAAGKTVQVLPNHMTRVLPGEQPSDPVNRDLAEQISWGMASGGTLNVVLPVTANSITMTETNKIYYPTLSHDGNVFAYAKDDPASVVGSSFTFFDILNQAVIQDAIPDQKKSWGVFFNPVRSAVAYDHLKGNNVEICVIDNWNASMVSGFVKSQSLYTGTYASQAAVLPTPTCFGGDGKIYGWPFWSPDGEWILFYSNWMGSSNISNLLNSFQFGLFEDLSGIQLQTMPVLNLFKIRSDGSELTSLNPVQGMFQIRQIWSPDSQQIAYVTAQTYEGPGDLWVMDADGGNARMIFANVQEGGFQHLAWSPDGQWLAAPSQEGGLWLVHPDGSDPHPIPGTSQGKLEEITWSQNESGWPLYYSFDDGNGKMVYIVVSDGADPAVFINANLGPVWSPDGSRLVFAQNPSDNAPANRRQSLVAFFSLDKELWP